MVIMGQIEKAQYYYSLIELYDHNSLIQIQDNKSHTVGTIIVVTALFILLYSLLCIIMDKWIKGMRKSD